MDGFYLILFTEIGFSALVSVGLIWFVKKSRRSQLQEKELRKKEVGMLEHLVDAQDKVLDEYRSLKKL
jgi:hypothetical protein